VLLRPVVSAFLFKKICAASELIDTVNDPDRAVAGSVAEPYFFPQGRYRVVVAVPQSEPMNR
jgi:hypothetical protein